MSDSRFNQTTQFKLNDRVRIMQTREMEAKGYANVVGRIVGIDPTTLTARVQDETTMYHNVPLSALMKC